MVGGLDDVIAAETVLSDVDGAAGRLVIRGHALAELAGHWRCERIVALLFDEFFANLPDIPALQHALGQARIHVANRLFTHLPDLAERGSFDGLRAGIALLPDGETLDDALRLMAAPAVLLPAIVRLRAGQAPIAPDADLAHAADMIRMLTGEVSPARIAALETYLATVCDHGLNASTFATRVVASTGAGLMSCALAGLGALKGPLHGGAPGPVIEMLDAIAADGDARRWLTHLVQSGGRIMGFGHRIYRVRDPRADALKAACGACPVRRAMRVCALPSMSSEPRSMCCAPSSPTACCRPMSSSTPRCCWRRSASRPRPSPACSRRGGWLAGWPMPASRR